MEKKMEHEMETRGAIVPLKLVECERYEDFVVIYPKPYLIYLRGTINPKRVANPKQA